MTAALLGSCLAFALAALEPSPPAAAGNRTYASTAVPLDQEVRRSAAATFAGGALWVSVSYGEVLRFDSSGKGARIHLPGTPGTVQGIWPEGAGVVMATPAELFRVSSGGLVRSLGKVDETFRRVVPVRGGYVGLPLRETRPVFVGDAGDRRELSLDPVAGDSSDSPDAEAVETRPVPTPAPQREAGHTADGRSMRTAPGGFLALMDPDHVVLVEDQPYRAWILGLDGSSRFLEIDSSPVPEPKEPALEFARVVGVEDPKTRRVEFHEGRLVVGRTYRFTLEHARDHDAHRAGAPFVTFAYVVDFVDLESGRVVERLDVRDVKDPGAWAGFRGRDQLVLISPGPEPYMSFASPQ